jgi:hypothetical protein
MGKRGLREFDNGGLGGWNRGEGNYFQDQANLGLSYGERAS